MFIAHAALNQEDATGGMSICEIHKTKRTLLPPSEYGKATPRDPDAADYLDDSSIPFVGDKGNVAAAKLEVARVLKDRQSDYARYPCLKSVIAYYRVPKWGTSQNKAKMDSEMELLFTDKLGFRAYGPKGTQVKCQIER